jgi:predicted RNA-binding protein YlqC (UPF0109 family)
MDLMESRGEAFASESLESLDRFVLGIAKALVDTPSSVRLETTSDHQVIVLRLYVAPEEIGQLIGSQGRIARALRTIVGAASMRLRCHARLEIMNQLDPLNQNPAGVLS